MTDEADFYRRLRARMRRWLTGRGADNRWAEYLMFAPDLFHLLWSLSLDEEVPRSEKVRFAAAIAYFVSPMDLVPEALLGPVGYVDDIALAAYVLNGLINRSGADIVRRHWAGDADVLDVVRGILAAADEMLGSGLWRQLKRLARR